MPGKKPTKEKKRKNSNSEESNVDTKRRSTGSSMEDLKEDVETQCADEPSDIEEGGLDLSVQFKPISAYVTDRHEMLEQCFRVLGEYKLKKMLPDELKSCTFDEIKQLCWEQLEQLSQSNLIQILEGEEVTGASDAEEDENRKKPKTDSQQDNSVDSTSSLKENIETDDKPEGGGSGEESDVLSINADMYDSDIEGHIEEVPKKLADGVAEPTPVATLAAVSTEPEAQRPPDPKRDLQKDIEKSVCEILALESSPAKEAPAEPTEIPMRAALEAPPLMEAGLRVAAPTVLPRQGPVVINQPSAQQLELLELEMRARAIKALMKAGEAKKQTLL